MLSIAKASNMCKSINREREREREKERENTGRYNIANGVDLQIRSLPDLHCVQRFLIVSIGLEWLEDIQPTLCE